MRYNHILNFSLPQKYRGNEEDWGLPFRSNTYPRADKTLYPRNNSLKQSCPTASTISITLIVPPPDLTHQIVVLTPSSHGSIKIAPKIRGTRYYHRRPDQSPSKRRNPIRKYDTDRTSAADRGACGEGDKVERFNRIAFGSGVDEVVVHGA